MNKKYQIGQSILFSAFAGNPAMKGIVLSKKGNNRVRIRWDKYGYYGVGINSKEWVNLKKGLN